ncbi:Uu.00g043050.m01.CDS01 [Anthostomella pinea]|uniref:Uu.00g043050.m01.CDS01 n=1 Tax=Anthostomella pinea TaxID=933095 RepID=A0AAI8YE71_9PEZI|nr:Uu.00g043050.m01.CDS01 [Anthostomella pinea]
MPPRSSLTSSFSITDSNNEVVCPLRNQDGSSCRKRCIGEKRYRSMQEHIRRAHPEHYISKLPATEESFLLMINTPPSDRSQVQNSNSNSAGPPHATLDPAKAFPHERHAFLRDESSAPGTPRNMDEFTGGPLLPAASAAAALAQLGGQHKFEDWESEADWQSDTDGRRIPRSTIELPPFQYGNDPTSEPFPMMNSGGVGRRDLLPSILSNSPPGRSSTLPPLQRPLGPSRPRKQSVTKRGHKKQKSRGSAADWLRRIQNDDRLIPGGIGGIDRKAQSMEPTADYGKRWEDLIDAAASATEDIDEDRTPVPQSPISVHRASLPPFPHQHFQGYQASPLQQALTPPSFAQEIPEPFPSVESGESGDNFHIGAAGLSDSSPTYSSQDVHIYCAACQRTSKLRESYACTECICGLCGDCVNILMEEQGARRKCPRCATVGGRFKPFQLDIR